MFITKGLNKSEGIYWFSHFSSQYLEECLAHCRCSIPIYRTTKWINNYISNTWKHLRERICRYWSSFNKEQTAMTSCHNKQMHVKFHCFSWPRQRMTRESGGIWKDLTWFHSRSGQKLWLFKIIWIFFPSFSPFELCSLISQIYLCSHLNQPDFTFSLEFPNLLQIIHNSSEVFI